jgi:transcriptional regulator with XRE-family HTH domain
MPKIKFIQGNGLNAQLRHKRMVCGLSQKELAKIFKVSVNVIGWIEKGVRKIPKKHKNLILRILKTKNEVLRFAVSVKARGKDGKGILPK